MNNWRWRIYSNPTKKRTACFMKSGIKFTKINMPFKHIVRFELSGSLWVKRLLNFLMDYFFMQDGTPSVSQQQQFWPEYSHNYSEMVPCENFQKINLVWRSFLLYKVPFSLYEDLKWSLAVIVHHRTASSSGVFNCPAAAG